jgi:hypothetical protein
MEEHVPVQVRLVAGDAVALMTETLHDYQPTELCYEEVQSAPQGRFQAFHYGVSVDGFE